jgi:hypothetical protein
MVMVGHVGPIREGQRLIEAPGLRRLFGLSQDDSPLSQHG